MGAYSRLLRKILSVKMRNLRRNPVYQVSARRELSVSGAKRSPIFYFIELFLGDRPVETVEKKVNCLLGVTFR